jgi:alkylhydroperoxidase family enzyme
LGVTEAQRADLARYRDSAAFGDDERLVLDLAVEMARTPVPVPPELTAALRRRFGESGLVELVATVAWENYRARFNRPLGVQAVGFSAGAACAVPERAWDTAR